MGVLALETTTVVAGLCSHVGGGVAEPRLRAEQQRRLAALRLVVRRPELRPVPPEQRRYACNMSWHALLRSRESLVSSGALLWAGYAHLAQVLYKGLAIPPSPPAPPAPPAPPGVWVYQNQGLGKLFIPAANFTANKNSGRAGKLGWDACAHGANGTRFDNGVPLWPVTTTACKPARSPHCVPGSVRSPRSALCRRARATSSARLPPRAAPCCAAPVGAI